MSNIMEENVTSGDQVWIHHRSVRAAPTAYNMEMHGSLLPDRRRGGDLLRLCNL